MDNEESSRKLENPIIVDEESASSNLVRQRSSGKKRRESENKESGAADTYTYEQDFNDTINTDRYAL